MGSERKPRKRRSSLSPSDNEDDKEKNKKHRKREEKEERRRRKDQNKEPKKRKRDDRSHEHLDKKSREKHKHSKNRSDIEASEGRPLSQLEVFRRTHTWKDTSDFIDDRSEKFMGFKELSDDDYFSKNNEFSTWLKEERGIYFSDLSSEAARNHFSSFIKAWNKQKLQPRYYDGIASAPRSGHNWKIKNEKSLLG